MEGKKNLLYKTVIYVSVYQCLETVNDQKCCLEIALLALYCLCKPSPLPFFLQIFTQLLARFHLQTLTFVEFIVLKFHVHTFAIFQFTPFPPFFLDPYPSSPLFTFMLYRYSPFLFLYHSSSHLSRSHPSSYSSPHPISSLSSIFSCHLYCSLAHTSFAFCSISHWSSPHSSPLPCLHPPHYSPATIHVPFP